MSTIKYAIHQSIATVTLNRDEKRNAINGEMAGQLLRRLAQAETDGARVVVLRANPGVPVWCAGHDLAELETEALHTENPTLQIVEKIQSTPLPVIAAVEGEVYAGGLIIVLSADIVIATTTAKAAITSNKIGIPLSPESHAYWLRVMGIHKVKELLLTAAPIAAEDAYHAGLYNHVVKQEELEPTTAEVARRIIECSPDAVANAKYQLNLMARQTGLTDEARADVQRRNAEILETPETKERIAALLARLRGSGGGES